MIGNPTFYKNNIRVITGLTNLVYDNDVVLLCDTSLGAVNLTLLEIPADRFSTQYKIYVVDQSNNAGVNNITITAPTGFSVNNSSTAVINVNSGVATITISSNTTYNAQFNYIVGGGGAIVVKNEGTIITSTATSFNFVGVDVNATAVGGDVTVNVQSSFVLVTNAQLLTLISTNLIVPNTSYLVSDAIFLLTLNETVPIIVQGITTNSVSLSGSGIFLNADYQQVGDYSGVSGFVANIGVWKPALTPVVGDVVIWNNLHYKNITGVVGTDPQFDAVNWSLLTKTLTNGYIQEIDNITYNPTTNYILSRQDNRNNSVENNPSVWNATTEAFYCFQWGNDQVASNLVSENAYFSIFNNLVIGIVPLGFIGAIFGNNITGFSSAELYNQLNGVFQYNFIDSCGVSVTNSGFFISNKFEQNCVCTIENLKRAIFRDNQFYQGVTAIQIKNDSPSATMQNNVFRYSRSLTITSNTQTFTHNFFSDFTLQININSGAISENYALSGRLAVSDNNLNTISRNNLIGGIIIVERNEGLIDLNTIDDSSVVITTTAPNSQFSLNQITKQSQFTITTMNSNSYVDKNVLESQASVSIGTISGYFGKSIKGVGNIISGSQVILTTIDFGCEFSSNVVQQKSDIRFNQLSLPSGQVIGNTFAQSIVNVGVVTGEITSCQFINIAWTGFVNHAQTLFGGNTASYVNTIQYSIDLADPTIYDLPTQTLTIPNHLQTWVGTFKLLNANTLTIAKIDGLNTQTAICFINDFGIVKFTSVAVAGALFNEIVSSGGAVTYNIVTHAPSLSDKIYITLNESGVYNTVYLTNIFT